MESETALEEKGKNKIERGIRIKPMKYFENILRNIMIFKDKKYLNEAEKLDKFVIKRQFYNERNKNINGGIPGSDPIWGKYGYFSFPNWAVKFNIDSLLLKKELKDGKKIIYYAG